jgi:histidyl-tRNA synthetase
MVFEIFDTNTENPRSLFGGGRYDDLLSSFGGRNVPAVGFGMGDVTALDFLNSHKLLPKISSAVQIWLAAAPDTDFNEIYKLAAELREKNINVGVDVSGKKVGDQIAGAEKRGIPLVLVVGKDELESGNFKIKRLADRTEKEVKRESLAGLIRELLP